MIFVAETASAVWWATMMQLPYIANASGTRAEVMALAFRSCLSNFTVWAFQHQCSVAGNAIVGHAEANFVMRLRNAAMRAILSQDREFHDIHTVGVLQERINHTCRVSAHHLTGQPKALVVKVFKVAVRLSYMYAISPRLFAISMFVPLPLGFALAWVHQRHALKLQRKIHKVNDLAVGGTIDVLKELTTVRQFAMEDSEHEKYALANVFRRMLEQRLDVLAKLTHGALEAFHVSMHSLVVYFGIELCLAGSVTPATVFTFGIYNREICTEIRWLIGDLIPSMIGGMLPLGLLCAVLGASPTIEPPRVLPPDRPAPLRPAKFRGHIVFTDASFSYPTELQKPVLRGISFEVTPVVEHLLTLLTPSAPGFNNRCDRVDTRVNNR